MLWFDYQRSPSPQIAGPPMLWLLAVPSCFIYLCQVDVAGFCISSGSTGLACPSGNLHFSFTCLWLFWTCQEFRQQWNTPWDISVTLAHWAIEGPTGKSTCLRLLDTTLFSSAFGCWLELSLTEFVLAWLPRLFVCLLSRRWGRGPHTHKSRQGMVHPRSSRSLWDICYM